MMEYLIANVEVITTPITDHRPPITDHRLPTADHRPPTTDHRPPTTDYRPPITDHRSPTTDYRPPTTDHRLPTTDHRPPTTDYRPPTTDYLLPNPRCRQASKTTTAAAVETFIESIFPCMGMMMLASDCFTQASERPVASVPMTIADGLR